MKIVNKNGVDLPDFSEEIERGVAILDEAVPGWYNDIDPSTLNLASSHSCVLGQTFLSTHIVEAVGLKAKMLGEHGETNFQALLKALRDAGYLKEVEFLHRSDQAYAIGFDAHYMTNLMINEYIKAGHQNELGWSVRRMLFDKAAALYESSGMHPHEALTFQWVEYIKARRAAEGNDLGEIVSQVKREDFALAGPKR